MTWRRIGIVQGEDERKQSSFLRNLQGKGENSNLWNNNCVQYQQARLGRLYCQHGVCISRAQLGGPIGFYTVK